MTTPTLVLDCLGMKCPRPVIELARSITEIAVGDVVEVMADDPAAGPDIAAWCRMRQHILVASSGTHFQVRRCH